MELKNKHVEPFEERLAALDRRWDEIMARHKALVESVNRAKAESDAAFEEYCRVLSDALAEVEKLAEGDEGDG